jgi:tetratricopeptide (TPR) repeat protein
MADIFAQQGKTEEVIALWNKALQVDPEKSYVHFRLGELFARQGQWHRAVSEYRAEMDISPYYWKVYGALSRAVEEREKHGKDASPGGPIEKSP